MIARSIGKPDPFCALVFTSVLTDVLGAQCDVMSNCGERVGYPLTWVFPEDYYVHRRWSGPEKADNTELTGIAAHYLDTVTEVQ